MNDDSKQDDVEEIEAEVVDPDEIELLDPVKVAEDHPSLLPTVTNDTSVVRVDPLTAYLNEVRRYEGLTEEEERELAVKLMETGDANAAYRLTTSHLMLVVRIAMTFRRQWQNMMDLIQEGNVGLLKAVKNFDPFRGARLSSYATWWIRSYILKYMLDNWRLVRVGTTNARRKLLYNLRKEKEKLELQGYAPTTKLLAEHFGVDETDVIDVQASLGAADVSVDTPLREGEEYTPAMSLTDHSEVTPEQHAEQEQFLTALKKEINIFKKELKPIEQEILTDRVLSESPRSLQEIGDDHNITREAVRQTEQRILKKFKSYVAENMPDYSH
ncbi:MAG TPA: RNA polymerase factor sigma-32 [Nitrospinaceae bacterium]|jgi:RNA polymerase sigma-32 factor|nr:RNA polymerase subunit sigma [Nitrospinota bacterium]MDP6335029.1 RNA polymerase factor sigma-32 [Nitrospinaceae bacterium]HAX47062.1 RNA polymerase subunit sigma [Nitrospina sp.]MDP7148554.1 RNA polymerase factor sigma-32 [Nitrospinaceae bacterium]MDP7611385.1 RNA polymerase factor sigma-32 [Nitrospinaceae bacterium]|tara:strand:+ start:1543 stop:2526 length:984 start_codon:yes stop_codon:yes gene_type:complete